VRRSHSPGLDLVLLLIRSKRGFVSAWATLGQCQATDGEGQIYARAKQVGEGFAIMYSWFFPYVRDSVWKSKADDWQQIVVWVSGQGTDATKYQISHIAYSQPDHYKKEEYKGPKNPLVRYEKMGHKGGMDGRGLSRTLDPGWPYKMVAWEKFTEHAKAALRNNFPGDYTAPFSDSQFGGHIDAASKAS